ncbi:HlyD family secretion protein [Planctomycetota bacterium]
MKNKLTYRSGRLGPPIMHILIWLVVALCVVGLFYRRAQRFEVVAVAQGEIRQISVTCTGRLVELPVQLFQEVKKGDTVAVLDIVPDDENIDAQLATVSAQIQELQAQLVYTDQELQAQAANLQTDNIADQRRFYVDVENARLKVLELDAQIETDRIMLQEMELNTRAFTAQAAADTLADPDAAHYQRQALKVQYNTLAKQIETNTQLLSQARQDLKETQRRSDEFTQRQLQQPSIDNALEVIRKSVRVQELLMEQLKSRARPLVLKSPIDGLVIQVHGRPRDITLRRPGEAVLRRPGEVVLAGDSILTIAEPEPHKIIAYINQNQLGLVREGKVVQVVKNNEPAQIATSTITHLGPTLERLPEWLWQIPNIPQWGIPVQIDIPAGMKLTSGEVVAIRGL